MLSIILIQSLPGCPTIGKRIEISVNLCLKMCISFSLLILTSVFLKKRKSINKNGKKTKIKCGSSFLKVNVKSSFTCFQWCFMGLIEIWHYWIIQNFSITALFPFDIIMWPMRERELSRSCFLSTQIHSSTKDAFSQCVLWSLSCILLLQLLLFIFWQILLILQCFPSF